MMNSDKTQMVAKLGNYILLNEMGYGSSCKVYKAINTINNEEVAVKVLNKEITKENMNLIEQEIDALT